MESKKIYAIVAVIIVVVAAVAIAVSMSGGDKETDAVSGTSIIGRVNTDGSGIFVKEGVNGEDYATISTTQPTSGYYLGEDGCYVVFNKDAWAGSVFGVPATSSIQYIQLGEIATLLGLNYQLYVAGQTTSSDTLYYVANVASYSSFESTLNSTPAMVGAIMWEPQYSIALLDNCDKVATTNEMFPGHTCCIIGASNEYITSHTDETVRFLAAYVETVQKMNEVIAAGSGEEYDQLIQVAMDNVAMAGLTDEQKKEAIEAAFELVVYTYADNTSSDPLSDLKDDVAELAVSLYEAGAMRNSYSDLGFSSASALADAFVDSSYMASALNYTKQSSYETANITVAVIGGDIHQLAIHYGIALGIFAEYGINVTLSSQSAGPTVYNAVNVGEADIGFLGAPPMTINAMNNGDIKA
ncbi:MAG: hypothetical protein Q4Q58_01895 [Thermoplasmata archaeon]|nr:hypothetical protein [Thermoplasmata archaeon]